MNDFLGYLQAAGPFTAPLCAAMVFAMKYLVTALGKMEARAVAAETDAKELRDKRTTELVASTSAMAEFGEAVRDQLRAHDEHIEKVLDRLNANRRLS